MSRYPGLSLLNLQTWNPTIIGETNACFLNYSFDVSPPSLPGVFHRANLRATAVHVYRGIRVSGPGPRAGTANTANRRSRAGTDAGRRHHVVHDLGHGA